MPTSTMYAPNDPKPFRWRQAPPGSVIGPRVTHALPKASVRRNSSQWTCASLFGNLVAEWTVAANTTRSLATVRSWAQASPALEGYTHAVDVLIDIDNGDGATKDAKLAALVDLAQGGDRLAGRTVLQAMLPKLTRLALCVDLSNDRTDDRAQVVVVAFLDVLDHYPLDRRPARVAGNLALDTLHALTKDRRTKPVAGERPVADIEALAAALEHDSVHVAGHRDAAVHSADELSDVLAWAVNTGVVSAADADLLTAVYSPASGHSGGHGPAAADRGLSPAAVRQRCSRATRTIRRAVVHSLEATNAA